MSESETKITEEHNLLKAAAGTDVLGLSAAIKRYYDREPEKKIFIRAIGAGAVNQAYKSIIISARHFSQKGVVIKTSQWFTTIKEQNTDKTAIEILLHFEAVHNQ